ncbi:MAG: FtsH protease activity modulator HflK [Magnetococcales bacterium]|nr:FtsH protease activity modulator HflK [Magnetococcales bacterium]
MSWDNNGGRQQGPWGQGPNTPPPPDMEKVFKMARDKFGGNMPGGSMKAWPIMAGIAFLLWMSTGIYVVGPDEQGVVVRFGKYVQTTKSGPHFHLPFPIETVYKPKVTQVQRIELGYRTRNRSSIDVPVESLMLTGDENIVDIDLTVQYRIKEAADYLFNVHNPARDKHKMVRNAVESAIRQVIGTNEIDNVLTFGKDRIQADTKMLTQAILDDYKSGVHIMSVQLQNVAPPKDVIHAFKDVASAREDRERAINEAHAYANDILPKARGEAARVVQEAEAYKAAKEARSKGDAQRFLSLLTEYEKAKDVTRTRLYLESMEEVMGNANKVIVESGNTSDILPLLPLGGLGGMRTGSTPQNAR